MLELAGVLLEQGRLRGPVARACAALWERVASRAVVRRIERPEHVRLVVIGGATLGGSGKTPLAVACARELARAGARVALVGHAYRARPGGARVVGLHDPLSEVGDEALLAAADLAPDGVPVVVAPTRRLAVDHAAKLADVLVVDGVVQARPRAALALLAVDANEPWGAGRVPPCGDLRAARERLVRATDHVVQVADGSAAGEACIVSRGVWVGGAETLLEWSALKTARVGLVTALARPARVLRFLARRGVLPQVVLRARDHGPVGAHVVAELAQADPRVDLWLASPKCALHFARWVDTSRLAVIDYTVALAPRLSSRLRGL